MASVYDPCSGTEVTINGAAPYSVATMHIEGREFVYRNDSFEYAPVTYTICLDSATLAKLFPAPVAPPSSGDSGLAIIVVFALIAQLVVNVIAIRKPTRGKS